MRRCSCGGFVPRGISRCPNCGGLSFRSGAGLAAGLAVAAQLVTACNCYGGPVTCTMVTHRGMSVDRCTATFDCTTPLADGGSPTADSTDFFCFTGSPVDGGSDGGP